MVTILTKDLMKEQFYSVAVDQTQNNKIMILHNIFEYLIPLRKASLPQCCVDTCPRTRTDKFYEQRVPIEALRRVPTFELASLVLTNLSDFVMNGSSQNTL